MTYALIVYAVAMTAWYARTLYCIRRAVLARRELLRLLRRE